MSTRKMNTFSNDTYLITYIDTRRSDRMSDSTAVIAASVVETRHQPGLFYQRHFLVNEQTSYFKHVLLVL